MPPAGRPVALDTSTHELRHDGDVVATEPQAFDVIVALIEKRGLLAFIAFQRAMSGSSAADASTAFHAPAWYQHHI